jgi:hypothetical protein
MNFQKNDKKISPDEIHPETQKMLHQSNFTDDFPNFDPLAPSDPSTGRTAQLTSKRCILNTYTTNIRTEYFKRAA